ncbi:hypothetical protein GGR50DRAFT_659877 [Xylaria sp. CBS 124048]|nr:hypothetical protein GGR50DRAFT_659877 [Xylaria sp. CBS 124048]
MASNNRFFFFYFLFLRHFIYLIDWCSQCDDAVSFGGLISDLLIHDRRKCKAVAIQWQCKCRKERENARCRSSKSQQKSTRVNKKQERVLAGLE